LQSSNLWPCLSSKENAQQHSAGFAYEIQTPLGGKGMEFVLGSRQYALNGVLNGIDTTEWNPEVDPALPAHYSKDKMEGKAVCKAKLQEELGLPVTAETPLIAFIGRLDAQKGADLILAAAPWIMQQVRLLTPCCTAYTRSATCLLRDPRALFVCFPTSIVFAVFSAAGVS
jgi:glycogen synthase